MRIKAMLKKAKMYARKRDARLRRKWDEEVEIHKSLRNHEGIVNYYGSFVSNSCGYGQTMFMECMDMSLEKFAKEHMTNGRLHDADVSTVCRGLLNGLKST